jgi:tRNA threonylcarbamoyl adenosine modification protein YeaZ
MHDGHHISLAIETSCRQGGLALGVDRDLADTVDFDASARHATVLVAQLAQLLQGRGITPAQVDELYVSAGPGSFTGLRVGVTVARTLGQQLPGLKCVAVPTALAVAQNAAGLDWQHLAVIFDAKEELVYASLFRRSGTARHELPGRSGTAPHAGQAPIIIPAAQPVLIRADQFLASAPSPITLIGEGLAYHEMHGPGVTIPWPDQPQRHLPTATGVWLAGTQLASEARFTDHAHLLPIYARISEAQRLWEIKHK